MASAVTSLSFFSGKYCKIGKEMLRYFLKNNQFHYELKSGLLEDRADGYAVGDYKKNREYHHTFSIGFLL